MYQWLGWLFIVLGLALIFIEVTMRIHIVRKKAEAAREMVKGDSGIADIIVALINKLPWMVIVGFLLIYLGLHIVGAPIPFRFTIG